MRERTNVEMNLQQDTLCPNAGQNPTWNSIHGTAQKKFWLKAPQGKKYD